MSRHTDLHSLTLTHSLTHSHTKTKAKQRKERRKKDWTLESCKQRRRRNPQSTHSLTDEGGSWLLRECLVGNIFVHIFGFDQPVDDVKILESSESGFEFGRFEGLRKFDYSL